MLNSVYSGLEVWPWTTLCTRAVFQKSFKGRFFVQPFILFLFFCLPPSSIPSSTFWFDSHILFIAGVKYICMSWLIPTLPPSFSLSPNRTLLLLVKETSIPFYFLSSLSLSLSLSLSHFCIYNWSSTMADWVPQQQGLYELLFLFADAAQPQHGNQMAIQLVGGQMINRKKDEWMTGFAWIDHLYVL